MAFSQAKWLADLGFAAEELGFRIVSVGVVGVRGTEIVLEPVDHVATRVVITSPVVSGTLLRQVLQSLRPVPSEEVEALFAAAPMPDDAPVEERVDGR